MWEINCLFLAAFSRESSKVYSTLQTIKQTSLYVFQTKREYLLSEVGINIRAFKYYEICQESSYKETWLGLMELIKNETGHSGIKLTRLSVHYNNDLFISCLKIVTNSCPGVKNSHCAKRKLRFQRISLLQNVQRRHLNFVQTVLIVVWKLTRSTYIHC